MTASQENIKFTDIKTSKYDGCTREKIRRCEGKTLASVSTLRIRNRVIQQPHPAELVTGTTKS